MSTAVDPPRRMSIEAYLAMEAASTEKHILWNGEVFSVAAMAAGTFDHNTGGAWTLRSYGPGAEVSVRGPDLTLAVDALYRMALEDDAG